MAGHIWRDPQSKNLGLVIVSGSFAPNGASAVDNTQNTGTGWTVAHTSTGLFTITFDQTWLGLYSANTQLQLTTGDDKFAQIGVVDVSGAGTLQIRVWDVSSAGVADIAAAAGNKIHFQCQMRNTTVTA